MSTAQHTPGPWHIGKRTFAPYIYGPKGEEVAGPSGFTSGHEETQANARLIAAAPDLLAALEEIASRQISVQGYNSPSALLLRLASVQSLARATIARATGAEAEGAK